MYFEKNEFEFFMSTSMSTTLIPYIPPKSSEEIIRSIAEDQKENIPKQLAMRPQWALFLDVDGVVSNGSDIELITLKAQELSKKVKVPDKDIWSIAATHFFNINALNNLDFLIQEMEKTKDVGIVISSNWRQKGNVQRLKHTFFKQHPFSKKIIGKTPDPGKLKKKDITKFCPGKNHESQCRASEIKYWLSKYPEIRDYIVIDDSGTNHLEVFGDRFYKTDYNTLLTREICNKILGQNR